MTIFGTKSPIDRFGGEKPKLLKRAAPGRLAELVRKFSPLMKVKRELDKVYSNGYFENYYPDADKLLKSALHDKAMEAWAHADGFGSAGFESEESDEKEERQINVTVNVG